MKKISLSLIIALILVFGIGSSAFTKSKYSDREMKYSDSSKCFGATLK